MTILPNHLLNIFTNKNSLVELIKLAELYLVKQGVESSRREAEEIIAHVLNLDWVDLYYKASPLKKEELHRLFEALKRRGKREPTAYIIGKVTFADLLFEVSPAVLVPRPETEILVEKITQTLEKTDTKNKVLWDVCTGSGCIGITLKKRFPDLTVFLSDLSEEALLVAKKNAALNGVKVYLKQGDLLAPFEGEQCDYFVSNPPYISEKEINTLPAEVAHFEPKMAYLAGKTGLEFYERLAKELVVGQKGWLELGYQQGVPVKSIFEKQGWRGDFEKDWAGHDRFFYFKAP